MVAHIVVHTSKDEGWFEGSVLLTDHWSHFNRYREAREYYEAILNTDDLYSASITVAVRSTDYDCTEALDCLLSRGDTPL